ncbi:tol-pal system protein YbgF [Thalassotalea profundi]|uniref:Cell division coordinator CpoB n=1 Tax=Thalassotalea profundi TaxID=2036687 RepID=A0ABQ3IBW9_9GAMM|nr:tol-pal system protein YbgF [Thalassotalea profundi]GHE77512.1 tol-pal system protein YbgF [Thalassotalea profundi]
MKLSKVLLGVFSVAIALGAIAAEPAPVIDISNSKLSNSYSTSERLTELERKLDARNRAQVNVQRQLDELQNEVNELRGITELHTHQLSQILERQRELYQELDRRVSQALKPANNVSSNLTIATNTESVNYSNNLTENDAYDHAVNLVLKDKDYDQAIPEFKAFNQRFPNSTYAPNAHYWLGQLLFNKGELSQAKIEFEVVVNQFSQSAKRSDALLKLGMVEEKQNNAAKAAQLYRQLLNEYPDSSAAKLAQPRLAAIK